MLKGIPAFKKLSSDFVWRALQVGTRSLCVFLIFLIASRFLSPDDFGIYNYITAVLVILIMLSDFGISTAVSRYTAEYHETEKGKVAFIFASGSAIIVVMAILIAAITVSFGSLIFGDLVKYIYLVIPLIFLAPLSALLDGIFRGQKRFRILSAISITSSLAAVTAAWWVIQIWGLKGAIVIQGLQYLIIIVGLLFFLNKFSWKPKAAVMKQLLGFSLIVGLVNLSFYFYTKIDVVILGQYSLFSEIGSYEITNKLFQIIILPFLILGQVLAPRLTAKFAQKKFSSVLKYFKQVIFATSALSLIVSSLFYLFFPYLAKWLFPNYVNPVTFSTINILIFILPLNLVFMCFAHGFVHATGQSRIFLWPMLVMGAVNVAGDYLAINLIGYTGVLYVTIGVTLIAEIIPIILYYRLLRQKIKFYEFETDNSLY